MGPLVSRGSDPTLAHPQGATRNIRVSTSIQTAPESCCLAGDAKRRVLPSTDVLLQILAKQGGWPCSVTADLQRHVHMKNQEHWLFMAINTIVVVGCNQQQSDTALCNTHHL